MTKLEKRIRKEAVITLVCYPEDAVIKGNCSAIDTETDAKTEAWILKQLDSGNQWAWATAYVKATWNGLEGSDSLGCCSYESEKAFKEGGYYEDMVSQVIGQILAQAEVIRDE